MLDDFPTKHGPEREAKILECINEGYRVKYHFVKIMSEHNGHKAEFLVFDDALKVDGIRINVTAKTQQQIADLLKCILPTAKLYDLMWHLCENRIEPIPRSITSTTKAMMEHSWDIDEKLLDIDLPEGLKSSMGKVWIIDNALAVKSGKACNYGWHFIKGNTYKGIKGSPCASLLKNPETGSYWYMIQSRGFHHGPGHVDYSQVCILVSRQCWVDGKEMDIHDVLSDPELAPLANHDGVLKVLRQPNVEELESIVDLPIQPEPEPEPEPPKLNPPPKPKPVPKPVPIYEEPSGIWVLIMRIAKAIFSLFGSK